MRLNHLNLPVSDVLAAHAFLETYFGLTTMGAGNPKMMGLNDSSGFSLVLMKLGADAETAYPDGFHIGFTQQNAEEVQSIYQRLKDDGFDVPVPREIHGGWSFYFLAPGGFTVEVSC
jgi:lactoylglutathione lyase